MRLTEVLPELAEGEGNLWSHSTGGEHASKFAGDYDAINALLRSELEHGDGDPTRQFSREEFWDMLLDNTNNTVVIVDRQRPDNSELTEDCIGAKGLVAALIADHTFSPENFSRTVNVAEIAVHPRLRQRGIASYMLEKAAEKALYGELKPTELSIATDVYRTEEWFEDKLFETGFKHWSPVTGSPAMWLPGNHIYANVGDGAPGDEARVKAAMPATWNGYIEFYDDPMVWFEQYRHGELVGAALMTEDTSRDDQEGFQRDYVLLDAGREQLDRVTVSNAQEALRLLLNNYDLVPENAI